MAYNDFGDKYQDLNLPEGCVITYNMFFDVEPPVDDPQSKNWWYFKHSLLQIDYMKTSPLIFLDLGWYPEFDPEGRFAIQVFRGNDFRGEKLLRFASRSKQEIVDKINEVFKDIAAGKFGN